MKAQRMHKAQRTASPAIPPAMIKTCGDAASEVDRRAGSPIGSSGVARSCLGLSATGADGGAGAVGTAAEGVKGVEGGLMRRGGKLTAGECGEPVSLPPSPAVVGENAGEAGGRKGGAKGIGKATGGETYRGEGVETGGGA